MRVFLFGSRAKGTAGPDSDWDVLVVPAEGPIHLGAKTWGAASGELLEKMGWWEGVNALMEQVAHHLKIEVRQLDLFIPVVWGNEWAARISRFGEGHECFDGLTQDQRPENLVPWGEIAGGSE